MVDLRMWSGPAGKRGDGRRWDASTLELLDGWSSSGSDGLRQVHVSVESTVRELAEGVSVVMCTYRRPQSVARLLDSIVTHERCADQLAEHPVLRARLGAAGGTRVERFLGWDGIVDWLFGLPQAPVRNEERRDGTD